MRFLRATRAARARVAREPAFAGITFAQYQLLDAAERIGSAGNARVAELAGVSGATATQALARLEQRGLLRRDRAPTDGRAVTITLTPTGRKLLEQKRSLLSDRARALFESLKPAERERAADLHDELAELVDQQ
ncbi:MAG: MarR family winged helix-turn-helix transcriptional regulator [Solirubrobacteraceae bacterium]